MGSLNLAQRELQEPVLGIEGILGAGAASPRRHTRGLLLLKPSPAEPGSAQQDVLLAAEDAAAHGVWIGEWPAAGVVDSP